MSDFETEGPSDHELLTQIEGISDHKATQLLEHFDDGSEVAKAACSYWGYLTDVDGISEENAKTLIDRMRDAEVFHDLRGY